MIDKTGARTLCAAHCEACAKKILGWTVVGNVFLTCIKLAGGVYANSSGLIADGLQSISCVATSIIIMASVSVSRRAYDERFPYGYAKAEFIVAFSAFSVLIGIGLFITLSNLVGVMRRDFVRPDIVVLPVAMASVFLAFMIYRYNICAGRRLESPGMIANGCHAGADLFSSGAVILGIVLAQLGPKFIASDRIAACIVGIVIVKDSIAHWMSNLRMLLDHVPDSGFSQHIEGAIKDVDRRYRPVIIKFRRVGSKFWVGVSLVYPPEETVESAETVTQKMRRAIIEHLPIVGDVDFFVASL